MAQLHERSAHRTSEGECISGRPSLGLLVLLYYAIGGLHQRPRLLHAVGPFADRLKMLLLRGIITKAEDPSHKQKSIYSLTEQGIALLPILAQMAVWGRKYLHVSEELGIRAQMLDEGGPEMWREFMIELRQTHIDPQTPDKTPRSGPSVAEKLQAAYLEGVAKRRGLT